MVGLLAVIVEGSERREEKKVLGLVGHEGAQQE